MKYLVKRCLQWIETQAFKCRQLIRGNTILARVAVGKLMLGHSIFISDQVRLISEHGGRIEIGDNSKIGSMSIIEDRGGFIRIGRNTAVNSLSVLYGHGGLTVGDNCIFATGLICIPSEHTFVDPNLPIKDQGETMKGIRIGDGVWIGARVTILDGVTVGDGAVIGAGAVVNSDIPARSIAVGIPARVIRQR